MTDPYKSEPVLGLILIACGIVWFSLMMLHISWVIAVLSAVAAFFSLSFVCGLVNKVFGGLASTVIKCVVCLSFIVWFAFVAGSALR